MRRHTPLVLICCAATGIHAEDPRDTLSQRELADFLGDTQSAAAEWRKYDGTGFTLFYCTAKEPRSGAAGLYFSKTPLPPDTSPGDTVVDGRLGRFLVSWSKRAVSDGSLQQEAAIQLGSEHFARVIIEARTQADLDTFVSDLSALPAFSHQSTAAAGPGLAPARLRSSYDEPTEGTAK